MLAVDYLGKAAYRLGQRNVYARKSVELLGNMERLRQEALNLSRARNRLFVLVGQLVHTHDSDDVHQLLVALQYALNLARDTVVLRAEYVG